MESFQQIPWLLALTSSLFILGSLFGLVLMLLKFPAARHLGKLLIGYAFLLLSFTISDIPINEHLVIILISFFLFIYARAFFSQKSRLGLLYYLPITLATGLLLLSTMNDRILATTVTLTYTILMIRSLSRESDQRGFKWFSQPGSRLSWFRNFISINIVGLFLLILGVTNAYFITGYVLVIFALTVYQSLKESSFLTPIPIGNKYQKSTLTPQIKAAVLDKIESVMDAEFYLRDDASLSNLAKELGVTTHHLSQVLNESLKISFQDLIARYRIRRACHILREEQHEQVKIESVAAMVGYNSKSSFNAAFKKRTGQTPTEYREARSVRSYGETRLSERERPLNDGLIFSLNHVFHLKLNKVMLRITLRNLRKYKLHSTLNILGLAVGLAACLTIAAYVHYELSYDKHHQDPENTYRLALNRIYPDYNKEWAITAPILGPTLTKDLPEVLNYTRLSWDDLMLGREDEIMKEQRITAVDSGFFEIFDVQVLSGDVNSDFFKKNDGIILTKTAAKRYFGQEEAIGKLFQVQLPKGDKRLVSVAAVIADPLPNSHFSYEVLGTLEMLQFPDFVMNVWGMWAVYTYVKVHPNTDPAYLRTKVNEIAQDYQSRGNDDFDDWLAAGNSYDYFIQPMTDIHLHSNLAEEFEANSSEVFVYFFALVGGFILLMAIVNFVNTATARASYRTLEVGIRKSVGASKRDLMVQFLLESTFISWIAMLFALPITQLFLPYFNSTVGKEISLDLFNNPLGILVLLITPFILGVLSGFYPALYLSNFGVAAIFQKLVVKRGKQKLRHLLVIGQLIIAVILMSSTITVFQQMHFMTTKPLGFDKDQLIKIDRLPFVGEDIDLFKQESKRLPGVSNISTSSFPLDEVREGSTIRPETHPDGWVNTTTLCVDENYLKTMGIRLIAGRDFRHDEVETNEGIEKIILNEAAAQALGWEAEEAVDQPVYVSEDEYRRVIGVVEDFNFASLHNSPEAFQLTGFKFIIPTRSATIRLDPRRMKETLKSLEELWIKFSPDQAMEYEFVDDAMAQYYEEERLTGNLFIIFSGLGIFICCLGLFGLMGYVVEQRSKEVGIRKVMGAQVRSIVLLLSKDYVRLVLIASVIAMPIACWGLNKWLDSFAYRIDAAFWIFILAGIAVTLITWFTVAAYSFQAARANPVDSLRSE